MTDQPCDRYDKWMSEIRVESFKTDLDWYQHITEGYRCTKSVELHSFQYKYFMRDLATRRTLNIMNIIQDNKCIKCNKHEEDIIHMFWGCKHVRKLWLTLHKWLSEVFNTSIYYNKASVLLHVTTEYTAMEFTPILTLIYTLVKQAIYRNREEETPLHFNYVKNKIRNCEQLERYIAIRNKKLQNHFDKWMDIYLLWRE